MNNLTKDFILLRSHLDDRQYLQATIQFHAAPVTAMAKPSVLLSFTDKNRSSLRLWNEFASETNVLINDNQLTYIELKKSASSSLVLFYNRQILEQAIFTSNVMQFLQSYGYKTQTSLDNIIYILKQRFKNACPHEVGVFLGIPMNDVIGFINNKGRNYLYCGYWKVYSCVYTAKKTFSTYNQAKEKVLEELSLRL
ncbi:DUF3793 family protein [Desulfuribacillus alkaliarsenatis]|uniref:DUF3793 domain-containing protein n=1 Tax=Desulfuribacillus alkaliarsenatis TaxID=766136 RepID=A0A1E5G0B5_9FIRM|nr:DUF3793 family protein [Desulfuribacillus alkaliarsenatis]OEF96262.1 hypothetical protein BHF68_08860 [Desulfuribacillus alkaliarsenatis]